MYVHMYLAMYVASSCICVCLLPILYIVTHTAFHYISYPAIASYILPQYIAIYREICAYKDDSEGKARALAFSFKLYI